MNKEDNKISEDAENEQIEEEYTSWKYNTPFLYDLLLSKRLDWPSLCVNWMKSIDCNHEYYDKQEIILGTQTSDQDINHLIIADIKLPKKGLLNINEYKKESKKIEITTLIKHDGEVNRAKSNNFNENIIATKSSFGNVLIFNKLLHQVDNNITKGPSANLIGHSAEGYGLAWSKFDENILFSGSNDSLICVWDINSSNINAKNFDVSPIFTFNDHEDIVEDICSSPNDKDIFYSVSDDKTLRVWDLREKKSVITVIAHDGNVNSVDINPINKNLLLTGSSDNTIGLWDIRMLQRKNYIFDFHSDEVLSVKWNKKHETVFASGSMDRKIMFWDISKIGNPLSIADSEDGPPELLLTHGGHKSQVYDIDWNQAEDREFTMASVEADNGINIFEISSSILAQVNEDKIEIK